ncbi:hypothetical protein T440DRAFT_322304 [Plenodomus tracheiphilus IPT5]|uniref:Uncharacterized protein n=1 Tax=Plenodomus tracheiphilus IPT5 TaxID=1408161 RepID=A0A6A7BGH9_9PLEO|nr:hypothetical protein T440DRAFT_322304 [Plenodomus tracheiphilus IPT5]
MSPVVTCQRRCTPLYFKRTALSMSNYMSLTILFVALISTRKNSWKLSLRRVRMSGRIYLYTSHICYPASVELELCHTMHCRGL